MTMTLAILALLLLLAATAPFLGADSRDGWDRRSLPPDRAGIRR